MSKTAFILAADPLTWRILARGQPAFALPITPQSTPDQIAIALAAALRQHGHEGQGVIVALPSAWCFAASIATDGLPAGDRAAMTFRLEEQLPLAAENFTADFAPNDGRALGVCVPNERVVPLVEALERAGVPVQSVTPLVMLASQHVARHAGPGTQLLAWADGPQVSLVALIDGRPAAWALVDANADQLRTQLELLELDVGEISSMQAFSLDDATLQTLAATKDPEIIQTRPVEMAEAAIASAPGVLSGRLNPWFELRRGTMAVSDPIRAVRRPLNATLAAAALLLLSAAAVFFYRGTQYDHLARADESKLVEEFKREFPGWTVPASVRAVVESEKRKLAAQGSTSLPAEARHSALVLMHDLLTRLPADAKLAIDRLVVNDTSFELEGRARAFEDVNPLVEAARGAGLDVPPPLMRKNPAGLWGFVLRGSKNIAPGSASAS